MSLQLPLSARVHGPKGSISPSRSHRAGAWSHPTSALPALVPHLAMPGRTLKPLLGTAGSRHARTPQWQIWSGTGVSTAWVLAVLGAGLSSPEPAKEPFRCQLFPPAVPPGLLAWVQAPQRSAASSSHVWKGQSKVLVLPGLNLVALSLQRAAPAPGSRWGDFQEGQLTGCSCKESCSSSMAAHLSSVKAVYRGKPH